MPTLTELLEAGVHFGHKKERSHPRAKEFIFTLREGIYVIDLDKTKAYLEEATDYLNHQVAAGKSILFVGTKKQAKQIIKNGAIETGMSYIVHRWPGGLLTNFETIRRSINELERLEAKTKSPEFDSYTKKEKKVINDKLARLNQVFEGIREMKNLPDVVFVFDAAKENLAVLESQRMSIPVVAVCDTDANPEKITYPIPANDDALKSIEMIMSQVFEAIKGAEGVKKAEKPEKIEAVEIKAEKEETPTEKAKKVAKTKKGE